MQLINSCFNFEPNSYTCPSDMAMEVAKFTHVTTSLQPEIAIYETIYNIFKKTPFGLSRCFFLKYSF